MFMLLLVDFIIRKNDVTENNTYAIFIYTIFLLMTPSVFGETNIIISAIFLLLSTRRILSLRTGRNIEKKLFDAGMYITLASLFYFWAILYFIIVFIAIFRLLSISFKLLLIPVLSFITVFTLAVVFYLLKDDSFTWIFNWNQTGNFDFRGYNKIPILIPITMLISLLLWMGSSRLVKITSLSKKEKPAGFMILAIGVVTIFVVALSPQKNGAELLFLFFPVSILTTNYIEAASVKERYIFNEILLWALFFLALIIGFILN
ncbi:hypothetical protein ULMS_03480 [Patiriisocius marinistellae]|uniref:Beta-carotene 15,15'-monooxygenase n=2 Tax=Patiriisocius marinistellae TaxID=2494560 RepID=A0A5J4FTC6_9FLAO|nr:hypothetical protein ULMS_03480 [Patiriisocius marinistellae]